MSKPIHLLSDSLGESAEKILKAGTAQFEGEDIEIIRHSFLDTPEKLMRTLNDIQGENTLIVYTFVSKSMRRLIYDYCERNHLLSADLLGSLLQELEEYLGENPLEKMGISNKLDKSYYDRIEAIEFAVKYDDGKDPRGIKKADIILLGISRTSKTPLAMYLANLGYLVANFPIVPEIELPMDLFKSDYKNKIFGLTHDAESLLRIRKERMQQMGFTGPNTYSATNRIEEELSFANTIYERIGCDVISVSGSAVEETANIIVKKLEERM